jgi:tryptophanyl-tRNA synthetase
MNYALESFTGIRPTADLTVANYIGAIKPILDDEQRGQNTAVFMAELHATTTNSPAEVVEYSRDLGRTLMASGVQGELYSQRGISDMVYEAEASLRGLVTVSRLTRIPTLKEKVMASDNPENASVALAMYPLMMAADIVLARPQEVPTGKDQKSHLEITNELIRGFNRTYGAELPEPRMRGIELPNIMSLDGSGRKMSKSLPSGAIFLAESAEAARRKILKSVTASEPGAQMDAAVDNMIEIAQGLPTSSQEDVAEIMSIGAAVKGGERRSKEFKDGIGQLVVNFLEDTQERRDSISDRDVAERIARGTEWFRPIGQETLDYMRAHYWGDHSA